MSNVPQRLKDLYEAAPTRDADSRPLMVRVAQGLCDEGYGMSEVAHAMNMGSWASASCTNLLEVHMLLIDGFQMAWIPTPGGVFGYGDAPKGTGIYQDSFSKSFEPAVRQELDEVTTAFAAHLDEYLQGDRQSV